MSDNPNEAIEAEITEMERMADEAAEASRAERGATKEEDEIALAREAIAETSGDAESDIPTPPKAVGRDSNLTSRHRRKNKQRGR